MFVADMVAPNQSAHQKKEDKRDNKKLVSFHNKIMREKGENYVKRR